MAQNAHFYFLDDGREVGRQKRVITVSPMYSLELDCFSLEFIYLPKYR